MEKKIWTFLNFFIKNAFCSVHLLSNKAFLLTNHPSIENVVCLTKGRFQISHLYLQPFKKYIKNKNQRGRKKINCIKMNTLHDAAEGKNLTHEHLITHSHGLSKENEQLIMKQNMLNSKHYFSIWGTYTKHTHSKKSPKKKSFAFFVSFFSFFFNKHFFNIIFYVKEEYEKHANTLWMFYKASIKETFMWVSFISHSKCHALFYFLSIMCLSYSDVFEWERTKNCVENSKNNRSLEHFLKKALLSFELIKNLRFQNSAPENGWNLI